MSDAMTKLLFYGALPLTDVLKNRPVLAVGDNPLLYASRAVAQVSGNFLARATYRRVLVTPMAPELRAQKRSKFGAIGGM